MTEDRTSRLRWQRIAAIGVLLPLLAAALLIWSASGRQAKLDQVPVAIVNNDQIITDPQPMAAGRSLTAALTHPDAGTTNLDWVLTDSKDATAGLHNGAYYAVLTSRSRGSSRWSATRPPAPRCRTSASRSPRRRRPRSASR